MAREELLDEASRALADGRRDDAANWLERYRDDAAADDRRAQSAYWAAVGGLAYETGDIDRAVAAFDHVVELTGYFDSLGDKPQLIAAHREHKGLLPVELPNPDEVGATPAPDRLSTDAGARLARIRDGAVALESGGDSADALRIWESAWAIVPARRKDWSWATACYAGMGESLFQLGDAPTAELAFRYALRSVGGEQARVLARLAQCAEARGDEVAAENFWAAAERLQPGISDLAIQTG